MARQLTIGTVFNARDRVSPAVRTMGSNVNRFGRNSRRSIGGVSDGLRTMRRLATIAVAVLTTGAIARTVLDYAKSADELVKSADRMGISIEALQELLFAADISGIEQSSFISGLAYLNRQTSELSRGQGTLYRVLAATNPELALQIRNASDLDEVFTLLMLAIDGTEDSFLQAEIAAAAFGRSAGADMVNLAQQGEQGLKDLRVEAHEMGRVMSEEAARDAEELNDSITRMKGVLNELKINALMPVVAALIPIIDNMRDWIRENEVLDAQNVQETITRIIEKMRDLWIQAGEVVQVIRDLNDEFDGKLIPTVLKVIGALIGIKIVMGLISGAIMLIKGAILAVKGIALVGGIFAMANPIGIAIGLLVALGAAAWALYDNWDQVQEKLAGVWDAIKEKAEPILKWMRNDIQKTIDFVNRIIDRIKVMVDTVRNIPGNIATFFGFGTSDEPATAPTTPNGGIIESRTHESNSVDVDINIRDDNNRADVQQKGTAPGLRLNLGGFF